MHRNPASELAAPRPGCGTTGDPARERGPGGRAELDHPRRRRLREWLPTLIAGTAIATLLTSGLPPSADRDRSWASGPEDDWRTAGQDGVNVAALFARLNDLRVPFREVREAVAKGEGPVTLARLSAALKSLGCRAVLIRTDPDEIRTLPLPLIVHLEDPYTGGGRFCLVISWVDHTVELIDGGPVTHSQLSEEDFSRLWTGYAIVPTPSIPYWKKAAIFTLSILLLMVLCRSF
jgi:hypothetical protein